MDKYFEYLQKIRRDLHQIPEIGFDVHKTSVYVKTQLQELGFEYQTVARTGVVAIKKGQVQGAIAFRADMDALMINEQTNPLYQSLHPGKMHACGHDAHMAILLGFAKFISEVEVKKTVVFIFQPAEEGPGGAKEIISEGVFERYQIDSIFGLHLSPEVEQGKIGLINKAMMAQNGEFNIKINGKTCHAAAPHLGSDAIVAASNLIASYQTIISRNLDPLAPAVITIGTISGGSARNIIAQDVKLTGTIRSFDSLQYQDIKTRINEVNQGLEKMYNVDSSVR